MMQCPHAPTTMNTNNYESEEEGPGAGLKSMDKSSTFETMDQADSENGSSEHDDFGGRVIKTEEQNVQRA